MIGNGQQNDGQVLCWPKRLLSADDLRRYLTGQRELRLLPRTVVTPLAADELKARGVRISWEDVSRLEERPTATGQWGYAQERTDPLVESAIKALERDGIPLAALRVDAPTPLAAARQLAEIVARADHPGALLFCGDAGLACCVANKLSGVRAAAVSSPAQATKARAGLGANLLAIEPTGRTFFELRQIVRTVCGNGAAPCPDAVADVLKELDGHAHR